MSRTATPIHSKLDGSGKSQIVRFLLRNLKLLSPLRRISRLGQAILDGSEIGYAEDRVKELMRLITG